MAERGLRYLNTDRATGVSMPDGQIAVFFHDLEATAAEAAPFLRRLMVNAEATGPALGPPVPSTLTSPTR